MDRMAQKHAREVKIALVKDRVERDGDLRSQTRIARQCTAEHLKVQAEHIVITEQLDLVVNEHNALVKTFAREMRQADVDRQTLYVIPSPSPYPYAIASPMPYPPHLSRESKCGNLEASLSLRHKQEEAKKRQHKAAMEKADNLSVRYKSKQKAFKIEEGQWRWKRLKQSRQIEVQKEDLDAKKFEVSLAAKKMDRKNLASMKSCVALQRKAVALGTVSSKLDAAKKVVPSTQLTLNFYSLAFPVLIPNHSLRIILRYF